jgi:SPP1 gp7 family putative phage head morphogenesis protein
MNKKDKNLLKLSEQLEKNYIKSLQAEYNKAYKQMQSVIYEYMEKFAVDGKLTRSEMYKYSRFQKLQAQLMKELSGLKTQQQAAAHLTDQYLLNYFYSGYILETEYQVKLAYGNIARSKIGRGVLTPMSKISLKNNRMTVMQKIQSSVVQSIAQGEGVRDLSARIRVDLEQNANNSVRIARTETTRVQNWAKQDSYDHAAKRGLPLMKRWVSTLDDATRDRHADLDGETVPQDKPFSNGLMYPGDQSGPPEETINCRCSMITVVDGYDNAYEYRRARGLDGKNEVIPDTKYTEWKKERVS